MQIRFPPQSIVRLLLPVALVMTTTALALEPTFYEPMQFTGPTRSSLFRLPVGETVVLTAGAQETLHPILHGGDTDAIRCSPVVATELGSARWECRALQESSQRNEVYFTVGDRKSRILVIQTESAPDRTLPLPPPALFPDPVLTTIASFRNPFPDTVPWSLAGRAAAELFRRNALNGFPPDGAFRGTLPVNRAEAAKILLSIRNIEATNANGRIPFSDVSSDQWFAPYVIAAADRGIIVGYGDGTFRPGNVVSTAEFLAMMSRTFALPTDGPHSYTDVPEGSWFAAYAGIAREYGLFPGRTSEFLPHQPLTREEAAIAVFRYLERRE